MSENIYRRLLQQIDDTGYGILTGGEIHPDIPTIHDVGHDLPTDSEVRHVGFGLFIADVQGKEISFDGGGAMHTARDEDGKYLFGWTFLRASATQRVKMGYDLLKVIEALEQLAQEYERTKATDNV